MTIRKLVLSLGIVALAAAPAAAVESLTGTWEGTLKCTGTDSGTPVKTKTAVTINVQDGDGVALSIVGPGAPGIFYGFVVADTAKPLTGILTGATCGVVEEGAGGVMHVDVKTKTGDLKASMKGDILLMNQEGGDATACTLTAKRVNETGPGPLLCALELP
jgi:hypothetical protein